MNSNYDDIIDVEWRGAEGRPRMPMAQRAKIFLPFAALKGYEEALEETRIHSEEDMEVRYSHEDDEGIC